MENGPQWSLDSHHEGRMQWSSCHSWSAVHGRTYEWLSLAVWLPLHCNITTVVVPSWSMLNSHRLKVGHVTSHRNMLTHQCDIPGNTDDTISNYIQLMHHCVVNKAGQCTCCSTFKHQSNVKQNDTVLWQTVTAFTLYAYLKCKLLIIYCKIQA